MLDAGLDIEQASLVERVVRELLDVGVTDESEMVRAVEVALTIDGDRGN